jgi:2-keto-4-pentenoate hydratase/2-oxohepta-3-ene-1,7-dioic acid hydratase in catechol pathway
MKLATIETEGRTSAAVVLDDEIVDLSVAAVNLPSQMTELLALGESAREGLQAAIDSGAGRRPSSDVTFHAPIPRPPQFFGIGLNYADHVAESGRPAPEFPTVFAKMPSCTAGPFDDVQRPYVSDKLDYEGELGLIIGQRCRHVPRGRAPEVIAGYTIVNDYSVRDYQLRTEQWVLGKSFHTHGVIGPWLVTADELDPHALSLRTLVNGELRQSSNTSNLIYDCYALVELLSTVCTLLPGDVVATGTPGGVGVVTQTFLNPGDVVRVEIDGIGAIENRIVQEPAPHAAATAVEYAEVGP